MLRIAATYIVLSATTLLVAACGGGGHASSSRSTGPVSTSHAEGTRIVYVRPTTKSWSLRPGYTVSARVIGDCGRASPFVSGLAYRCSVGNLGHGVCWPIGETGNVREAFCMEVPWDHRGTGIRVRKRLNVEPGPREPSERRTIWGVELTSGQRCVHLEGALSSFRGATTDFGCGAGLKLLGAPDKKQAVWTIREVYFHHGTRFSYYFTTGPIGHIFTAWYGLGAAT